MTIDIRAFFDMSYGLYIVGTQFEGRENAMIANTVFQVTAQPAKIAVSINKKALTHDIIMKSKIFCVQAVKEGVDMPFIGNFGFRTGRDFNKFEKYRYKLSNNKLPIITENTLDVFEVEKDSVIDLGTHTLFVGQVQSSEILDEEGTPLTYKYYQTVMRGKTPRGATTFKENY
jgi:ferric-chelate reductase [NAD(P)H]